MPAWAVTAALVLLAIAGVGEAADARLVDVVLAEVGSSPVMLSEVVLARALGLLGLHASTGPLTDAELTRYVDAQLAVREAARLEVEVPAADIDRAWETAGGAGLASRLEAVGIEPAWARRLLEANLRFERFMDLRFRDFAFVTDLDVDKALGPGPHDDATRTRTRDRLRDDVIARAVTSWLEDARQRVPIRRIDGAKGPWPAPFSLDPPPARR